MDKLILTLFFLIFSLRFIHTYIQRLFLTNCVGFRKKILPKFMLIWRKKDSFFNLHFHEKICEMLLWRKIKQESILQNNSNSYLHHFVLWFILIHIEIKVWKNWVWFSSTGEFFSFSIFLFVRSLRTRHKNQVFQNKINDDVTIATRHIRSKQSQISPKMLT